MEKLIITTNPFLAKGKELNMAIAKATVASFKLEGIIIPLEEALKMAQENSDEVKGRGL